MRKDILLGTILLITGALTPGCSEVLEVLGCRDEAAENYDANANADSVDQYGNYLCIYESCDVVPEYGFSCYVDGLGAFAQLFGSCVDDYGGTLCGQEPNPSFQGIDSVVGQAEDEQTPNIDLIINEPSNIDLIGVVGQAEDEQTPNIDLIGVVNQAEDGETQAPSEVGVVNQAEDEQTQAPSEVGVVNQAEDEQTQAPVSVSDCTGLKEAFQANCDCGVEYTHSGSLASVVDKSDCSGLTNAYKDCDCSQ